MRPIATGIAVEVMATGVGSYEVRYGDKFECPECGAVVITGFAPHAVAAHFQTDYAARVASHAPVCKVYESTAHKQAEAAGK
jgi:wobble nucleotide-excising tRNase